MTCEKMQPRLSEYLDHSLGEAERRDVEAHLASCPQCQEELAHLKQTVRALGKLEEVQPPKDFSRAVMDQIRGEQQEPSLWQRLFSPPGIKIPAQALAVLLVSSVAVYLYLSVERSQVDIRREIGSSPSVSTSRQDLDGAANRDNESPLSAVAEQQPEAKEAPGFAPSPPPLPAGKRPTEESRSITKPEAPMKQSAPIRERLGTGDSSLEESRAQEKTLQPESSLPAQKAMEPLEQEVGEEKIDQLPPPAARETTKTTSGVRRSLLEDRAARDAMDQEAASPERPVEYAERPPLHLSFTPFDKNAGASVIEKQVRSLVERLGGQVYPDAHHQNTNSGDHALRSNVLRISLPENRYERFRTSLASLGEFADDVQDDSSAVQGATERIDRTAVDWIEIRLTVKQP